ncbi:MAG: class I SAM-dependent methyltransferase [Clostridiaceae bacterium]|nr:class I SAM-dependent methyltransferase [Clostridiaceae bacterium]
MVDKTKFREKLIALRNQCGLSQNKLASMLCISAQAVSKWENGISLPDIDLLLPLSQILGVSVDYLLGNETGKNEEVGFQNNREEFAQALLGYDIPDDSAKVISAMSDVLPRRYLYKCAKLTEKDMLSYGLFLEVGIKEDGKKKFFSKRISLSELPGNSLKDLKKPLINLTLQAVNTSENPVKEIVHMFRCLKCGKGLEYFKVDEEEYLTCGDHKYPVIEGVVDFGTFEHHGNNWSSWIRSYDEYKKQVSVMMDNLESEMAELFSRYGKIIEKQIEYITRQKPSIILDIGSGMASFIFELLKYINWDCTIILSDISHRILKYDKRYIEEQGQNPNANLVYIACDARNLPIKDNSLDLVTSFGGFENIMGDMLTAIKEAYRVISVGGKCNYEMSMVSDKSDENVKRWLYLIDNDDDKDMPAFRETIFDLAEWHEINMDVGFSNHEIIKLFYELPPPDADKFPYSYEITRWMAGTVIIAEK